MRFRLKYHENYKKIILRYFTPNADWLPYGNYEQRWKITNCNNMLKPYPSYYLQYIYKSVETLTIIIVCMLFSHYIHDSSELLCMKRIVTVPIVVQTEANITLLAIHTTKAVCRAERAFVFLLPKFWPSVLIW